LAACAREPNPFTYHRQRFLVNPRLNEDTASVLDDVNGTLDGGELLVWDNNIANVFSAEFRQSLLLAALGLSEPLTGERLIPIGTLYDPFVRRGLDALVYATYSESRFIFAGTPSGISLAPEGGAHQSFLSPSIGVEIPNLVYFEPAFAQELEWILMHMIANILGEKKADSGYLRLSTRPVDQHLLYDSAAWNDENQLRGRVLRGGYCLMDRSREDHYCPGKNVVHVFATGVLITEAVNASRNLDEQGIKANVINITSADLLYRDYQQTWQGSVQAGGRRNCSYLLEITPTWNSSIPAVSVLDGHSHTLSFIGSALGCHQICLGVDAFGQSGSIGELYRHYQIDEDTISNAAKTALANQV